MKKTESNENEFFSKIEKKFNQLRGTPLLISPQDWALMEQWKKRGIPAIVIIEALEKGFENAAAGMHRRRNINSLSYFKQIVEDCWESFQKMKIGKDEKITDVSEEGRIMLYLQSLAQHLDALSKKHAAKQELSKLLRKLSSDIKDIPSCSLHSENDIELIEEKLSTAEDEIGQTLLKFSEYEEIERARREAEEEFSHMSDYVNGKHLDDMKKKFIVKKLRKKYGIPKVSLFFT